MRATEFLIEGLDKKSTYKILLKFIRFASEHLGLTSLPKFNFKFNSELSVSRKSFGGYGGEQIDVTVKNRHINDILRTLAHELVHYKQDLNNELDGEDPGATGSPQENDANAQAAVILRNWAKRYPNLFAAPSVD